MSDLSGVERRAWPVLVSEGSERKLSLGIGLIW